LAVPLNPPPLPADTPLVEENRRMNWFWVQFFTTQNQTIQSAASVVADVSLTAQSASIAATALPVGNSAAFYRVSSYARITRAATTSSSMALTIQWTEGGQALSKAYTALTANTVTTLLAETLPVRVDGNTSLTYTVTYASVGATAMQYSLELVVERVA
jgi:hypothetical protein